ncbi:MAG: hypothetical protein M3Q65_21000 [Chloroflexota bacterium]|nr:hypothetical protein [Chloroflexota bacterium]
MRRFLLTVMVAVALLAPLTPGTSAIAIWCEEDPPVLIETPGGSVVPIYVTIGALGIEHLGAVLLASITYTVKSTHGESATLVQMDVVVPDDEFGSHFETRATASTGPMATGTIYDITYGYSGEPMRLVFKLDVP